VKSSHKVDRLGKKTRFVALSRDAQFMCDFQVLLSCPDDTGWKTASVSKTLASTMFPAMSPLKQRSKRSTWWELTGPGPRNHRTPADPRDISVYLRAEYLMLALRDSGPVHSFTLNLRPDVEEMACAAPSTRDFLRRRLSYQLEAILGRKVDFFFVIEQATRRRVHLHGCLGVSSQDAEVARLALRKAGGEWPVVRQHQSHTEDEPDAKWNSYITKDCVFSTKFARAWCESDKSGPKIKFSGPALYVPQSLGMRAHDLYQSHRRLVLSALKVPHPAITEGRRQRAAAVIAFLGSSGESKLSSLHSA
jgi:hypothetical protein